VIIDGLSHMGQWDCIDFYRMCIKARVATGMSPFLTMDFCNELWATKHSKLPVGNRVFPVWTKDNVISIAHHPVKTRTEFVYDTEWVFFLQNLRVFNKNIFEYDLYIKFPHYIIEYGVMFLGFMVAYDIVAAGLRK
jgi:hypothetical protein